MEQQVDKSEIKNGSYSKLLLVMGARGREGWRGRRKDLTGPWKRKMREFRRLWNDGTRL